MANIKLPNDTLTTLTDSPSGNNDPSSDQFTYSIKLLMNLTLNSISTSASQLMSKSQSSKVSHETSSHTLIDHPFAGGNSMNDVDDELDDELDDGNVLNHLNPLVNDSSTFSINLFDLAKPRDLNSSSPFNQFSHFDTNYPHESNYNSTSLFNALSNLFPNGTSIVSSTLDEFTSKFTPNSHSSASSTGADCASHHDITSLDVSSIQFPGNYSKVLEAEYSYIEYIKITFTVAVIIAALTGNIGIILAISLHRSLRTTINYYLVNLAIADIFICTFCMSVYLINHLTEPLFILGPIVCKLNAFCQMTCLTSSVLTLSAISCDRFIAILYPLQARFRVTKHRTGILILLIWITSAIVSLPFLFMRKLYVIQWSDFTEITCGESWPVQLTYDPMKRSCIVSHPTKKIYYTLVTIALFFVPITVMSTAYICVVWKLWANVLPGEPNIINMNHQDQARKKVIKMVCIMLIAFIVCWVPLQVVVLYSQFSHSSEQGELPSWFNRASYIATFIAYCNSALNPIIYGGFNQSFRDALYNIFTCKCQRDTFHRPPSKESRGRSTRTQTIGSTINWSTNGAGIGSRRIERYTSELVEVTHNEFLPANNSFTDEPL